MRRLSSSALPGNPVANVITIILGSLALVAAFAFGLVLLAGFVIAAALFVSFISVRLWWLKRKLTGQGATERPPQPGDTSVVEAEYEIISRERDRD